MTPRSSPPTGPSPCACLLPSRLTLRSASSTSCGYSTPGTFLSSTPSTFSIVCVWHVSACSPPPGHSPPPRTSPPRSTLLSTRPQCPVTCALAPSAATAVPCSANTPLASSPTPLGSRMKFSPRRPGMAATATAAFITL
jgi:hypothetical protein